MKSVNLAVDVEVFHVSLRAPGLWNASDAWDRDETGHGAPERC